MKKLFLMPFSGKFIVPIVLFFATMVIYSCSKDNSVDSSTLNSKVAYNQNLTNPLAIENALVEMSGGIVDDVLDNIESSLNETYSYGDQSVMNIEETESEISIPISGGGITQEQAASIYTAAKNSWADAYSAFDGENKKAFLLDIERLENENPNEVSLKIRSSICEPQEIGAVSPCDDVTFSNTKPYNVVKTSKPDKSKWYAQDFLTSKLNKKINNNPCVVFEKLTLIPIKPEISLSKPGGVLNSTQMGDTYCDLLSQLNKAFEAFMNDPVNKIKYRGYTLASVVVISRVTTCTDCPNTPKLVITGFSIGKKKNLSPCDTNPKMPPVKE